MATYRGYGSGGCKTKYTDSQGLPVRCQGVGCEDKWQNETETGLRFRLFLTYQGLYLVYWRLGKASDVFRSCFEIETYQTPAYMKKIALMAMILLGPVIMGQDKADADSTAATGKRFVDRSDMSFQMRGSFRVESPAGGKTAARFRMDNFRWNIEGSFGKDFHYHFRQSFNADFKSNFTDNLLASIDYAYIKWKPFEKLAFTAGKQVFALGGAEFWAAPVYVMQFSDFGGSLSAYQAGLSADWYITPTQELVFQIANLRGGKDEEYYHAGLPEGVESSNVPFLYTINWNGAFSDGRALEFRYSASYGTQAAGRNIWILTGGQTYRKPKWGVYLDLAYSRQGLDANGLLSSSAVFADGNPRTIENVDYFSAIAYLHCFFTPSFSAFIKGSGECGGIYKPYNDAPSGIYRVNWNAQACFEYMPTKSRDFRLFLHYNYYDRYGIRNVPALSVPSYREHRISLGIIYIMNVF